jgi:hypothetical protein
MHKIALYSLSIFICSCVNVRKLTSITAISGEYLKSGSDYRDYLKLNADSTFAIEKRSLDVVKKCSGNWKIISGNVIKLICYDEPFPLPMSSFYMQERERTVSFISKKNIRIDNVVMRRVD